MLKVCVSIFHILAIGCVPLVYANPNTQAANKLAIELGKAHSVQFYFISRTEKYSLNDDEIKKKSSIRIYRECGNNCQQLMNDVIEHLRDALPINCPRGQQNLLVQIDGVDRITYSYSGRTIKLDSHCYFNKNSINRIIESEKFIFQ